MCIHCWYSVLSSIWKNIWLHILHLDTKWDCIMFTQICVRFYSEFRSAEALLSENYFRGLHRNCGEVHLIGSLGHSLLHSCSHSRYDISDQSYSFCLFVCLSHLKTYCQRPCLPGVLPWAIYLNLILSLEIITVLTFLK